jgi:hypothetical protein
VLVVLLVSCLGGCVSFAWRRELRFELPAPGAIENLQAGRTNLEQSLRTLGAPLWVWEHPAPGGLGAALAYGWYENMDRGLRVSIPVSHGFSASLRYDRIDQRMPGLVLFFGPDWKLVSWRTGLLQDLTSGLQKRRPAYLEDGTAQGTHE